MDLKCPYGNKFAKKEEKDFRKNKSTNSAPANISSRKQLSFTQQTSFTHPKTDGNYREGS